MSILRRIAGRTIGDETVDLLVDTVGRIKFANAQPPFSETVMTAVGHECVVDMDGMSTVTFSILGTHNGTTVFEQTIDGVNWQPFPMTTNTAAAGASVISATTTATGVWIGHAPGAVAVRARRSAHTSGAATVRGAASTAAVTTMVPTHAVTGTVTATPPVGTGHYYELAATTNITLVNGSTTGLGDLTIWNPTAAMIYVALYNKATAPVLASDTLVMTIPVAPDEFRELDFGTPGKRFVLGLGFAVTGGKAKNDTTNIAAGPQLSLTRF